MHQKVDIKVVFTSYNPAGSGWAKEIPKLYPSTEGQLEDDLEISVQRLIDWVSQHTLDELVAECQKPDPTGGWPVTMLDDDLFSLYVGSSVAPDLDTWLQFRVE